MANTNSIFYQIGTAVKDKINALLNPYTGVADIQNTTTLGTVAEHTQAFGGSTIRISGLDTSATYVDVEYKVGGGSSAAATFSSGNLIVTTDGSGTILDAIDVINSTIFQHLIFSQFRLHSQVSLTTIPFCLPLSTTGNTAPIWLV